MSVVVVGGGAIGMLVAGRLHASGQPVALLGRRGTLEALEGRGVTIRQGDEAQVVDLPVAADPAGLPAELARPELAILCVKGYDTPAAIESLRALGPRQILSLQNGIGNEEQLIAAFGAPRVLAGAITTSVDMVSPAEILVTKVGGIAIAPCERAASAEAAAAALGRAGFVVVQHDDYVALKWSKALLNMLGNAQAAILSWPVPRIYADARLVDLDLEAVREALAVMRAMGARPLNLPGYPAATLAQVARLLPNLLLRPLMRRLVGGGRGGKDPSLLRDLRAGRRRSEGELLYGAVAAKAAELRVPAPVNGAIWRVLGGIVAGNLTWEEYHDNPERLLREVGMF